MNRTMDKLVEELSNRDWGNVTKSSNIIGNQIYLNLSKNNKENIVLTIPEEMIWFGAYGNVYRIRIEYPNGRKYYLAQKVFKKSGFIWNGDDIHDTIKRHIEQTVDIHKYLKSLWLPVWNTLRKTTDNKSIVMSLWSQQNKKILSSNKSKDRSSVLQDTIIVDIDNIKEQLKNIRSIATQHHVQLSSDAFLMQYDTKTKEAKIIIGDYDSIEISTSHSHGTHNRLHIRRFIDTFIMKYGNIEKDKREELKQYVENFKVQK